MVNKIQKEFYNYLKKECSDINSAKKFVYKWFNELNQELPDFGMFSMRSMAHHVSNILENKSIKKSFEEWDNISYYETKYGVDLYNAMLGL